MAAHNKQNELRKKKSYISYPQIVLCHAPGLSLFVKESIKSVAWGNILVVRDVRFGEVF